MLPVLRTSLLNASFLTLALVLGEFTVANILGFETFPTWIVRISGSAAAAVGGRLGAQPAAHLGAAAADLRAGPPARHEGDRMTAVVRRGPPAPADLRERPGRAVRLEGLTRRYGSVSPSTGWT